MTTPTAHIVASASCLPVVVAVAAYVGGAELAIGALVAGVFAMVGLTTGAHAVRRFLAHDGTALAARLLLALPVAAGVVWLVGPAAALAGVAVPVVGTFLFAVAAALRAADVAATFSNRSLETA